MYEAFYGFTEKPFSILPDPSFLYMTKGHGLALSMLKYSLTNESAGICVISGEIGSGKTTLLRKLLDDMQLHFTTGMLTNTHRDFGSLLQWVSMTFGLDYKNKEVVEPYENFVNFTIAEYAKGKRTVLIIDEAQNLSYEALEELRMLLNINSGKDQLLQLILVGQPALRKTFRIAQLEQLKQRVTASYHLSALSPEECCAYIRHRLVTAGGDEKLFSDSACKAVWYHSLGVPRIINIICDTALVYAFAGQKSNVDIRLIHDVITDRKKNTFYATESTAASNVTRFDDEKKKAIIF